MSSELDASSHTAPVSTTAEPDGEVPSLAPSFPAERPTQEIPESDVPAAPLVVEADLLIQKAAQADPSDRRELAEHIIGCFDQMASRRGARGTADFIVKKLESGALENLLDRRGNSCRAAATRALIGLGYPYALEVTPEDLEHLRKEEQRTPRRDYGGLLAATATTVVGAVLGTVFPAWTWMPMSAGLLAGGILTAWGERRSRLRALGRGLLLGVTLGALVLAALMAEKELSLGFPWVFVHLAGGITALALTAAPKSRRGKPSRLPAPAP